MQYLALGLLGAALLTGKLCGNTGEFTPNILLLWLALFALVWHVLIVT